ncbi:MAG: hypothetical protein KKG00_11220 [Bacteroidetes bacterium]|nr:hypothetical protein [Bacteroidota bacterium]
MILLQLQNGGTYVDFGFYQKFESMETAVRTAYTEVLTGLGSLGDVASAIAAIGATLYIGMRVLGHFARAESIDVFPLLRPFAIGFLALNFSVVTDFLDTLMKPVETATQNMVENQVGRIQQIEQMRQQKIREKMSQLDQQMDNELNNWSVGQYLALVIEKQRIYIEEGFNTFLKNLFYAFFLAARLVILTTRAFFLIVLTMVGPLAFAIAIFSGFQDSHLMWIARYVQISLWFPMANILGTIVTYLQGKVITLQYLELVNNVPEEAQSGDLIYLVFMIIATLCYFTIPTIASYVISSSGVAGALQRMTSMTTSTLTGAMSAAGGPSARNGMDAVARGAVATGGVALGAGAVALGAAQKGANTMRNISKSIE